MKTKNIKAMLMALSVSLILFSCKKEKTAPAVNGLFNKTESSKAIQKNMFGLLNRLANPDSTSSMFINASQNWRSNSGSLLSLLDEYTGSRAKTEEILTRVIPKITFSKQPKIEHNQDIKTNVDDPGGDQNIPPITVILEIFDVTASNQTPQEAYYTTALGQSIQHSIYTLANATPNPETDSLSAVGMAQSSLYYSFSQIENQVNNDLGLSQSEKANIIVNFTLMKSIITSDDFAQAVLNVMADPSVNAVLGAKQVQSLGSFLKKVVRAVVMVAIVVACTYAGAVIDVATGGIGLFTTAGLLGGIGLAREWMDFTYDWVY